MNKSSTLVLTLFLLFFAASSSLFAQGSLTPREQSGFTWPSDIHGLETFFGSDILITIDDCNNIDLVEEMFTLLRDRGLTATFFPNSNNLNLNDPRTTQLWRQIYASGFEIGYHTTDHHDGWTRRQLEADFADFTQHLHQLLGDNSYSPRFVRPPYGNWNRTWLNWVQDNQLVNVRWNYVPNAYHPDVDYYQIVRHHPQGGNIILIHPRNWDRNWLNNHIDDLITLARQENGRIISLSGSH